MALPQFITANRRQYAVVEDTVFVQLGLVQGLIRDSVTGGPPATRVLVESDHLNLAIRTEQNRWFGISGSLELAFPNLAFQSYVVNLTVQAPGYRTVNFAVTIPQNAVLPISAPDVLLHREPVILEGRVTTADTSRAPISNALVRAVDPAGPPPAEHIHLLRRPVQIDRPVGATARSRVLNAVVLSGERSLVGPAAAGSRSLLISSRQGLAPGQILQLGSQTDGEYAVIQSVAALPADPSWPGLVSLESPLTRGFPAQAGFQIFTAGAAGPAFTVRQPVSAGTSVLVLDGVIAPGVMEVTGPGQPPEYHLIGAVTDAAGYYRIPGVGSVSLLNLDASATGFNPLPEPVPWMVLYDKPVNRVDFRLAP